MCVAMAAVKSDPTAADPAGRLRSRELGDSKRRLVDRLKRAESTPGELAAGLGLTEAAVRQHLDALAANGLVTASTRPPTGRGRPAQVWALTDLARDLFPDHHDDLTVDLLDAMRRALGDDGLAAVIDARADAQLAAYRKAIPKRGTVRARVEALARVRTEEGYLAEVIDDADGDIVLVEHHCPICVAAAACQNLCRSELDVFRAALGDDVTVERTQHLLGGDRRCAYKVHPVARSRVEKTSGKPNQ
jgi:predicted ArsR family transcriptional regulator